MSGALNLTSPSSVSARQRGPSGGGGRTPLPRRPPPALCTAYTSRPACEARLSQGTCGPSSYP
eukprot:12526582-Alexandrium_andersonii.AAC.1